MSDASATRMMVSLGLAGALSGLILVGSYQVTAPRIERNRKEALEAAVYRVLPGAVSRSPVVLRDGAAVPVEEADVQPGEVPAWAGRDADGRVLGYAIASEGTGFQDVVALLYGYDPARHRVVGMEVLESKETPGLGDKIVKDAGFVGQFDDLAVDPLPVVVKKGKGTGAANEVDAIAGATISSNAVVRILGEGHTRWGAALDAVAGGAP